MIIGYIDPSSGGLLTQLIIAGLAGFGVFLKVYSNKIKKFFSKFQKDRNKPNDFR